MLGGLWAYVRLDAPPLVELLHMLQEAHPPLSPLLPTAVAMLSLMHTAAGHSSGATAAAAAAAAETVRLAGLRGSSTLPPPPSNADGGGWAAAAAAAALQAAGIRAGDLALHLGRHFSLRDLFKWCRRMQVGPRLKLCLLLLCLGGGGGLPEDAGCCGCVLVVSWCGVVAVLRHMIDGRGSSSGAAGCMWVGVSLSCPGVLLLPC